MFTGIWHFSLNIRIGQSISPSDAGQGDIASTTDQISDAIRFGQSKATFRTPGGPVYEYHLQVATIGGTLLAKLYTVGDEPEHAMTIGVAPSHARSAKLLWEGMVENPRVDEQPKRPVGSWCAYRIEMVQQPIEVLDWLKNYSLNLAFAWLAMMRGPAR